MLSTETSIPSKLSKPDNKKSAFYTQHIRDWQQSGTSQVKYCKSVNISYPAFVYWRIKFLEQEKRIDKTLRLKPQRTVQAKDSAFTQIKIKGSVDPKYKPVRTVMSDPLVLIIPNGIELVLPIAIEDQRLVSLARALWGMSC